ncbi:MAG: pyridoxamine 5'-phosphate oxidase [Solirubrobacteraceae bacterium]|nr:pyridoxamine 5'-phosphate oxidase [Solirubrobacteraceae bacterium]
MSFADERRAYLRGTLPDELASVDPLHTLTEWITEAKADGHIEATAMALATVDPSGAPAVRQVLCKGVTAGGVQFFTNTESRKGRALAAEPRAAASFWWPSLERTVRLVGTTHLLPREEVDAYFASRPRGSRLGAWASNQSQPIGARAELEDRVRELEERFPDPEPHTAPQEWGGYELVATEIELWQGRDDRIHDRLRFDRATPGGAWVAQRLQP